MHSLTAYRLNELAPPIPSDALRRLEGLRQRLRSASAPGMPGSVPQDEILRMLGEAFAHAPDTAPGLHGIMRHVAPQAGMSAQIDRARVAKILAGVTEILDALREAPVQQGQPGLEGILGEVERALDIGLSRLAVSGLKEALAFVKNESAKAPPSGMGMGMYRSPHAFGGSAQNQTLDRLRDDGFASHDEARRLAWLESGIAVPGAQAMCASVAALREIGRRVSGAAPRVNGSYMSMGPGGSHDYMRHYPYD